VGALRLGNADGPLDHEAKGVAERAMATADARAAIAPVQVTGTCDCAVCAAELSPAGQASRQPAGGEVPASVYDVLGSPGEPLDCATRARVEPYFGRDFSPVRVHRGSPATRRMSRDR
jgi:Domain of unknown function (DUF4157)